MLSRLSGSTYPFGFDRPAYPGGISRTGRRDSDCCPGADEEICKDRLYRTTDALLAAKEPIENERE